MRLVLAVICLASVALLGACNAVYFYETDKVSLTVEVRPDSTGPVQGNFGLKQRVVAFVPKRNGKPTTTPEREQAMGEAKRVLSDPATTQPAAAGNPEAERQVKLELVKALNRMSDSDAMSVLSSMRFHKLRKPDGAPWYEVAHITMDAALITGGAARIVANPARSIGALSGQLSGSGSLTPLAALESIYRSLQQANTPQAAAIVGDLDALSQSLPQTYPVNIYTWADQNMTQLQTGPDKGDAVQRQSFADVTTYWGQLNSSIRRLSEAVAKQQQFDVDGVQVNPLMKAGLAKELAETKELRDALQKSISSSRTVRQAVEQFGQAF